jgi:hypothetical protein
LRPILFDEGTPRRYQLAEAFRALGLDTHAVGEASAPPVGSDDDVNCQWCAARGAILVTTDRGKKDGVIIRALATHGTQALFLYGDLRGAGVPAHHVARALLRAEAAIDATGHLHHRLRPTGKIERRGKV